MSAWIVDQEATPLKDFAIRLAIVLVAATALSFLNKIAAPYEFLTYLSRPAASRDFEL